MIITLFLSLMTAIIVGLFSALPALPDFPQPVQEILSFTIQFIKGTFSFINHIYTPPLAAAIVSMILAILLFDQIYYTVRFILRKLHLHR